MRLDVRWIHGSPDCSQNSDPPLQEHWYDSNTCILRQNKCVHFEAPFLYLLFGSREVLLHDTGATADPGRFPLRQTVERLRRKWAEARGVPEPGLVITHSHGHPDHRAGDGQFAGMPNVRRVSAAPADVAAFFDLEWPTGTGDYDLGGRVVEAIPVPGHSENDIALYDRQTELLLSGDVLYPGMLFIDAWDVYRESIPRLAAFCEARPLTHILGAHVEMTRHPYQAYPYRETYQPEEHVLELGREHLLELREAVERMGASPRREPHPDFIIEP